MNIVFDLKFSFCINIFCKLEFFQVFAFANVCLLSLIFLLFFFVGCQIHFGKFHFLFYTMVIVLVKEVQLNVAMDDLDFGVKNVAFETKVFNGYDTFDRIVNRSMDNPTYAYLHCDLLL